MLILVNWAKCQCIMVSDVNFLKVILSNCRLQGIADTGIALTILCAFCFVPAGYIIYLIHERVHQEKQLQMICGVGILQYWFSAFIWDMVSFKKRLHVFHFVVYD